MGKFNGEFWPLVRSKSLIFFKFELDIHDYVPEIYTKANFHFNPFSLNGLKKFTFSDRWNNWNRPPITVLWLFRDFFLVTWLYCVFSRARDQVEPVDGFSRFMARRVFTQGRPFWGLRQYRNSLGVIAPQNSPKGRTIWIDNYILKPNGPNIWKSRYLYFAVSCKV